MEVCAQVAETYGLDPEQMDQVISTVRYGDPEEKVEIK